MKKGILFLAVAFIVASCTLTEKVVFNSSNGGEIYYELDGTEFANFMEASDTTGKGYNFGDSLDATMRPGTELLNGIKGISQVQFTTDSKKIKLSFSFDNIEALNKAHVELGAQTEFMKPGSTYEKVSVKNKKEWVYRTFPLGFDEKDSAYAMMGMMLTYKLDATFPKTIKSVDPKTITASDKQITWSSTAEDAGAAYAFDGIKVKLK